MRGNRTPSVCAPQIVGNGGFQEGELSRLAQMNGRQLPEGDDPECDRGKRMTWAIAAIAFGISSTVSFVSIVPLLSGEKREAAELAAS